MVRGTRLVVLFLVGWVSSQAAAAEGSQYGIGAGASAGGALIYFPIRTTALMIEPHIAYYRREDSTRGSGSDVRSYPPNQQLPDDTTSVTSDQVFLNKNIEIGLGIFLKNQMTDDIELYYGGRLGYQTEEWRNRRMNDRLNWNGYLDTYIYENKRELAGYFLAPTVGLQYFPRPTFSLGIEVSLRYTNLSGTDDNTNTQTTNNPNGTFWTTTESGDADTVSYDTRTAVVIRGYF